MSSFGRIAQASYVARNMYSLKPITSTNCNTRKHSSPEIKCALEKANDAQRHTKNSTQLRQTLILTLFQYTLEQ